MNTRLAGLTALAVALGGYVAVGELGLLPSSAPVETPAVSASATRSASLKLNPLDGLDPEGYSAVIEKPLFNPTREPRPDEPVVQPPPQPPVVEQPPPPPPAPQGPGPDDYKLLGISAGPDGRIAALRVASTGEVVYLRKGESVDNWSVVDVGDRSVAIGPPDNPVTFSLFDNAGAGEGSAGQPQPQPQPAGGGQAQPLPLPLPLPLPSPQPKAAPGQPPLPEQHTIPDTGG